MQHSQLKVCYEEHSETNYISWSPTIGIFHYVSQPVERMLTKHLEVNYVVSSPTIAIFLWQLFGWTRDNNSFGMNLCFFESHSRHTYLCNPGSFTRFSNSF